MARNYSQAVEIIALRTWDSREYGLVRTGLKLTVDERYGKEVIRKGMAKLHIPPDMEQPPRKPVPENPARQEQPPNPPRATQRRPARAAGSATNSSGRRRTGGVAKP